MMATRLSDSEFAARTRKANQQRAARQLERRRAAGLAPLNVWIDATTKARLEAARYGATLNATAERLLLAGLDTTTPAANRDTADTPVATQTCVHSSVVSTRDMLMAEVGKLLNEGHSGAEVARRLTAAGYRSPNGAALTSANLLRDYRRWLKRDAADSHETDG